MESRLSLFQDIAVRVFPSSQQQKRKSSRQGPELGIAGNLRFRVPAKELGRNKKRKDGPQREGKDLYQELPDGKRFVQGARKGGNKISGRQEEAEVLDGVGQVREREGGARKENQRQPDELVEDLSLLHGVSDAGDHQAERAEGKRADGDQNRERKNIADTRNMKDDSREKKLDGNGGKGEHKVRQEAGGQHVRGGDRRDGKAAPYPLLAEHDKSGAESPQAAHHVAGADGAKKITYSARNAAGG